ncbi:PhoU domain-containing protein [Gloeocapsopsis crepidinum LEGE 06123]|uniref:PhoU domain-containing protein n=1 Tax=Gloeocapsopsis crepidinum LEGE 06123 TaxID=588587 RepID=A0ABR9UZ38_9CHRO|nr:PhoU domain-containing protein [Gloeocapsopsis crepidinum]MBE9193594.1 PhoU domain-containing protein [Gloeocapsopsis crepidinum LEGE 06123]
MKTGYTDIVVEMSQKLCQALLKKESDLAQKVHELDGEVNKILRRVGFFVVSLVLAELST